MEKGSDKIKNKAARIAQNIKENPIILIAPNPVSSGCSLKPDCEKKGGGCPNYQPDNEDLETMDDITRITAMFRMGKIGKTEYLNGLNNSIAILSNDLTQPENSPEMADQNKQRPATKTELKEYLEYKNFVQDNVQRFGHDIWTYLRMVQKEVQDGNELGALAILDAVREHLSIRVTSQT